MGHERAKSKTRFYKFPDNLNKKERELLTIDDDYQSPPLSPQAVLGEVTKRKREYKKKS